MSIASTIISKIKKVRYPVIFFMITVLALVFRYPYMEDGHVDEVHTIGRALKIIYSGDINPHFFKHPTGTMYLCIPAEIVSLAFLSGDVGGRPNEQGSNSPLELFRTKYPTPTFQSLYKGFVSPHWDKFRLLVRWFNVLLIPVQIFLLAYIGKRTNLLVPALSAGLLLAFCGANIRDSSYVSVNSTTGTFCVLAMALMAFFISLPQAKTIIRWMLRAGAIAFVVGLATACKYNAGTFLLLPILFSFFTLNQCPGGTGRKLEIYLISLGIIAVFCALGFTALCPYWFKELPVFVRDVLYQVWYFKCGHKDYNTYTPGLQMAWINLRCIADQYSWTGLIASFISAGYLAGTGFFTRPKNKTAACILLPALAGCVGFFLLMSNQAVFFARNFSIVWSTLFLLSTCSWWFASGEFAQKQGWKNPYGIQLIFTILLTLICILKANFIDIALFGDSREWWRHNDEIIGALKYWF